MNTRRSPSNRPARAFVLSARTARGTSAAAGLLLTLLAGCVPVAINPFYTDEDLFKDPRLVGQWTDPEGDVTWRFADAADKGYRLTLKEDSGTGFYEARLFKLDDHTFLDLTQDTEALETSLKTNSAIGLMVRTHFVGRVRWAGEQIKIGWLSTDWLEKQMQEKPDLLAHQTPKDGPMLLTGSTRELQAFLRRHATNDETWEDDTALSRQAAAPTEQGDCSLPHANGPGTG